MSARRYGKKPTKALSARVRAMLDARGVRAAAKAYGLSPGPLVRIAAGLQVAPGTLALVERCHQHWDES